MKMADLKQILEWLKLYQSYKSLLNDNPSTTEILYVCDGRIERHSSSEVRKIVDVIDEVYWYFETKNKAKARFMVKFFFENCSRAETERKIGLSHGTVKNWRREIIEITAKIARRAELI